LQGIRTQFLPLFNRGKSQLLGSTEEANAKKYEGMASSEMSNSPHVSAKVFGTPKLADDDIPL
jgi:hypothetical protein